MRINLGCGSVYDPGWRNLDYAPSGPGVERANLLGRLPIEDGVAEAVYSSHFLEHVPRTRVPQFLGECRRITRPGGRIRLVLPDLEELCDTYLRFRRAGLHEKADFLILEMFDQCVRTVPGGELGRYFAALDAQPLARREEAEFVFSRLGHQAHPTQPRRNLLREAIASPGKVIGRLQRAYCRMVLKLLPTAFREQNLSLATTGERHAWMYDFSTLQCLLTESGFTDIQRMTPTTSGIRDFPFRPLDVTEDGAPRKGAESMYVEAIRA